MKGDLVYWSLARALNAFVWGGELINPEDLPEKYPVVFISNHAAALGPIAVTASLPLRVYPWVISDMLNARKAPEYLRTDFIEPQLHLPPRLSPGVAALVSKLSVRLLNHVGCIPVWQGGKLFETYRLSLTHLAEGRNLLIFPEDPGQPMHGLYPMTSFYRGFARLGGMYYKETGHLLGYCPMAVHPETRRMKIGKTVFHNPKNDPVRERARIRDVLESTVQELYLSITLETHTGIPLPQ